MIKCMKTIFEIVKKFAFFSLELGPYPTNTKLYEVVSPHLERRYVIL